MRRIPKRESLLPNLALDSCNIDDFLRANITKELYTYKIMLSKSVSKDVLSFIKK